MKRGVCAFLCFVLVFSSLVTGIIALDEGAEPDQLIYFQDGSYITVQTDIFSMRASRTVTGNKSYTYHSSDGTSLWKAVLTGTFSYNGSTSRCTAASCNVTVYESDWYTISKSASKSGDAATAAVTMGKKLLGVTVSRMPISITLTCDKDGNLS